MVNDRPTTGASQGQSAGFLTRIRQNLSLKIISLIAAILLYIYVQQERNPTISKNLTLAVEYRNKQDGYQVIPESQTVNVTVTGPRTSVERLKDTEVRAAANLAGITNNQPNQPVQVTYSLPKGVSDVTLDIAPEFVQIQMFRQKTRKLKVEAAINDQPPPGLRYGERVIRPSLVTIRGREDFVNRVDKIIAPAAPVEPKGSIDGDFTLMAYDSDHNGVEGVEIDPPRVHVTVPQLFLPSERVVGVNILRSDNPAPPYIISDTSTTPNQLTIIGKGDRVAAIAGINTETLSVHDFTSTRTIDAKLILPPDVKVHDLLGRPITQVKITFIVIKSGPEFAPPVDGGTSPPTTKKNPPSSP